MKYNLVFQVEGEIVVDAPSKLAARDLFYDDDHIRQEVERLISNNEITLADVRLLAE